MMASVIRGAYLSCSLVCLPICQNILYAHYINPFNGDPESTWAQKTVLLCIPSYHVSIYLRLGSDVEVTF